MNKINTFRGLSGNPATSKMFDGLFNGLFNPLTIVTKNSILNVLGVLD